MIRHQRMSTNESSEKSYKVPEQHEMANQICGIPAARLTDEQIRLHIGRRLKRRRMLLGMTQQRLAQSVGTCFQQIPKYESGENGVSASRLFQISLALEVPVTYFFEGLAEAKQPADTDVALGATGRPAALGYCDD